MSRIAVIGGGLTGLSACHYVRKLIPSAQVSLFEKNSNYGGWIKTIQIPVSSDLTIPIELGPNSIRGGNDEKSKQTAQLIAGLGLTDQIVAPSDNAKKRLIYHNDTFYPLQKIATKYMLSTMIWMPWQQMFYYLKGGHSMRYYDESIAEFFDRNFGKNVTKILASSFVNGVYGGGIDQLSIKACSPLNKVKEIEMEYGSFFVGGLRKMMRSKIEPETEESEETNVPNLSEYGSFTFDNGLQQLIDALLDRFGEDENVSLFNNFCVNSLHYQSDKDCIQMNGNDERFEFDAVINAVQPRNCSTYLNANGVNLSEFNLSSSIISVNVVFKKSEFVEQIAGKFEGFGVLIPREETADDCLLGIIYYSSVFPLFDGVMSLVFMFGGPQFDIHSMTKEHVVDVCKAKLMQMYNINVDEDNETEVVHDSDLVTMDNAEIMNADIVFNINRLDNAIDHYQVGHLEKLESLRKDLSAEYGDKLFVVGSGYDGVGIPDCILSAHKCVQNMAQTTLMKLK